LLIFIELGGGGTTQVMFVLFTIQRQVIFLGGGIDKKGREGEGGGLGQGSWAG
jgi:hypothetical protein